MTGRHTPSWQVILADLALILFLTVLAGFAAMRGSSASGRTETAIAGTQAIYRPGSGAELEEWLADQQRDSRLQLTVFARYGAGDRDAALRQAGELAGQAAAAGYRARLVLEPGTGSDIHVALAYDRARPRQ